MEVPNGFKFLRVDDKITYSVQKWTLLLLCLNMENFVFGLVLRYNYCRCTPCRSRVCSISAYAEERYYYFIFCKVWSVITVTSLLERGWWE
jgi:hypothetical protein